MGQDREARPRSLEPAHGTVSAAPELFRGESHLSAVAGRHHERDEQPASPVGPEDGDAPGAEDDDALDPRTETRPTHRNRRTDGTGVGSEMQARPRLPTGHAG
jgi:hypothetical protein